MGLIPGLLLAFALSLLGQYLARVIGIDLLALPRSPISPIMMAIVLGIVVRNTVRLSPQFDPGVRFCLVRILRLGIILLGIRLSLSQVGVIGLRSLPIIVGSVAAALLVVTWVSVRAGRSARLGTLIAVGTSICGATAIVATAPTIDAHDDEVSYSVACITLSGMIAMLVYPFLAHWCFSADAFRSGLFLGTAVHETAQVVGLGVHLRTGYETGEGPICGGLDGDAHAEGRAPSDYSHAVRAYSVPHERAPDDGIDTLRTRSNTAAYGVPIAFGTDRRDYSRCLCRPCARSGS